MTPLKPRPPREKKPLDPASVRPYDLTAPQPVALGRLKQLDAAYERFAKAAGRSLTLKLGHNAELGFLSTDGLRYSDLISGLAWPAGVLVLALDGAPGTGLLIFESALVSKLVELSLGKKDPSPGKEKDRLFSRIDLTVIQDLAKTLLSDLNACWAGVLPLSPTVTRMESESKFITELSPEDVVVATTFDLRMEKARGAFVLALPLAALKPHEKKLR
jgi:flagellar motor switch protein FliM